MSTLASLFGLNTKSNSETQPEQSSNQVNLEDISRNIENNTENFNADIKQNFDDRLVGVNGPSVDSLEISISSVQLSDSMVKRQAGISQTLMVDSEVNENDFDDSKSVDNEDNDDVQDDFDPDDKNIPDVTLTTVEDLPKSLCGLSHDDVKKALRYKYDLMVKDENTFPDLYMITYEKRERESRTMDSKKWKVELTEEMQKVVDQFRGVIVEKNTHRPLCYTFDRMSRHLQESWDITKCHVTDTYDGSQMKIFFYKKGNFWVVSTTRCIDASRAYFFSNKSFLEMFQDAATGLDWGRLNKKCCYSFVLSHPENRVVARHDKPMLTHVLTRNMDTFQIVENDHVGIAHPRVQKFRSRAEMWNSLKKLPYYREGYVIRNGSNFVKIVNKKYQDVKNLRGNSSSLLYHFFDLRKQNKNLQFLKFYPEFRDTFAKFEDSFYNLCCLVYNEYVLLRVRKVIQPPQVLHFLKHALYQIHGLHLKNYMRVRLCDVQNYLETLAPHILRRLVDSASSLPFAFL